MLNGDPVEFYEPFALRHFLVDEYGIEVFHIGQTDQFVDGCIIPDIAFQVGILLAPRLCSHAEHGHIQHVGFVGVDDARLFRGHFGRN